MLPLSRKPIAGVAFTVAGLIWASAISVSGVPLPIGGLVVFEGLPVILIAFGVWISIGPDPAAAFFRSVVPIIILALGAWWIGYGVSYRLKAEEDQRSVVTKDDLKSLVTKDDLRLAQEWANRSSGDGRTIASIIQNKIAACRGRFDRGWRLFLTDGMVVKDQSDSDHTVIDGIARVDWSTVKVLENDEHMVKFSAPDFYVDSVDSGFDHATMTVEKRPGCVVDRGIRFRRITLAAAAIDHDKDGVLAIIGFFHEPYPTSSHQRPSPNP